MAPARIYSLAYLSASSLTPPQAVQVAAQTGYSHVGLRLLASAPGGAFQPLLSDTALLRETLAHLRDTAVGVFDLEVIRLGPQFDPAAYTAFLEVGAALQARAVLVIGEDPDASRLAQSFGRLCEVVAPYAMSVDLEFLPWGVVPDARAAMAVLADAGKPANAGVLVDALHVARSSTSLADIAALAGGTLHYAQICDAPAGGPYTLDELIHTARLERLLPGEGGIALAQMFGLLPQTLPISVEIPHHVRQQSLGAHEWARQALAASRAVLEPAG
jgi:sugar phosphate isomerase/epimerase